MTRSLPLLAHRASFFHAASHIAAASVAEALKKDEITVRDLTAPLRPLNNIVTAASQSKCTARFERLCAHRPRLPAACCRSRGERDRGRPRSTGSRSMKEIG